MAELLIALAILGVIATFTIPKILSSQNDAKRFAIFKETIAALNDAFHNGCVEGAISETNFGTYMIQHLNARKICSTNSQSEGCWEPSVNFASQANLPGAVLNNGAFIAGLDDSSSGTGSDLIIIDWNGLDGPNTEGNDQIALSAVIDNTSFSTRVTTIRYGSGYPNSQTLWNQIFQQ